MLIVKVNIVSSTQACLFGSYSVYSPNIPTPTIYYSGGSVELGLHFYSDVVGYVTGVRFYKSAATNGTFTGSLWSMAGVLISTANFGTLRSSGWQTAQFPAAIKITAATIPTTPTICPSKSPSLLPSQCPTLSPSIIPSISPTISPSVTPTVNPTVKPTQRPTSQPSMQPSLKPTKQPTTQPSSQSSAQPTW
eukprot:gene27487-36267_t